MTEIVVCYVILEFLSSQSSNLRLFFFFFAEYLVFSKNISKKPMPKVI